jgi:putative transcriptional regulator
MRNRLKVLRAENDWSQARLAQELNVSRQTVNAIETGKYDPSLPLAFDIARLFGKSIEEIFFPEAPAPRSQEPEPGPEPVPSHHHEIDVTLI